MKRLSPRSVNASTGTSPVSQHSGKVGAGINQPNQPNIASEHSSHRSSDIDSLEDIRQRVQQESSRRGFPSTSSPDDGTGLTPGSKLGVLGRLRMQRVKKLRAFRQSSGIIYESSGVGSLPVESTYDSPAHPRTLSQRSLYDLSFSDPNFIAVTGWKPSAKNTFTRQKPRLQQYFNDPKVLQATSATGRPTYCCICGRTAYDFNPLIKVCHCYTESHSNCVVQQIICTGNYNCPLCNTVYNLNYGGCKPFWKWRCPPCHPAWCHLVISIVAWVILLCSITLLLLLAGPVHAMPDFKLETTIITSVVLVIVMCVCIVVIMITGAEPFCLFCQTFCLTNQDVSVMEPRSSPSGTSSTASIILRQITGSRQYPPKATTSKV